MSRATLELVAQVLEQEDEAHHHHGDRAPDGSNVLHGHAGGGGWMIRPRGRWMDG